MISEKLKELFLNRAINIKEEEKIHKKYWLRGFLAATIYSIIYGFYEYFVVYTNIRIYDIIGPVANWTMMYVGVVILVALVTKFDIEKSIMGLFYMTILEDWFYWLSQWIDTGNYPFPAGNWWDSTIASFKVIGGLFGWTGLGWPVSFWPYFPFYYIPGFGMIFVYYIASYKSARIGRIIAMIWGPFYLAIIGGALGNEILAVLFLSILPIASFIYFLLLLYRNDWKFNKVK